MRTRASQQSKNCSACDPVLKRTAPGASPATGTGGAPPPPRAVGLQANASACAGCGLQACAGEAILHGHRRRCRVLAERGHAVEGALAVVQAEERRPAGSPVVAHKYAQLERKHKRDCARPHQPSAIASFSMFLLSCVESFVSWRHTGATFYE